MLRHIRNFFRARDLLREWTVRTLRARYQQSILGWLWAVIQPATQAAVFTILFTRLVPIDTGDTPYVAFAYVATTAWAFLASSLTDMTNSLVDNMNLVNKIYFPREIIPVATMFARLTDFAVASVLFVGIAVYFQITISLLHVLLLPLVVLVQILLVLGLGLASAAMNVFVRDVRSVLPLFTQVWLYASPVIYPVETVPANLRPYYELNPMVGIIEGYRSILLKGEAPGPSLLTAAVVASGIFIVGVWVFKSVEYKFADIV